MDRFGRKQALSTAYPTLSITRVPGERNHVSMAWSQLPREAAQT
ncbi:hypothetical protein [Cellulosimicrobium sp. Marseille-Q4280]|nr:hypothetical protein [Cellulosimicrobium sp. Marseille-Q4280]